MNAYVLGSQVYVYQEFRNVAGVLVDPASLVVHFITQDGNTAVVTPQKGVDGVVTTAVPSAWFAVYTTTVEGEVGWSWLSAGAPIQGAQGRFLVKRALAA